MGTSGNMRASGGAPSEPIKGAELLATGQDISYATDDDGGTRRGRPVFTLPMDGATQLLNNFGTKWRITGWKGGYYDYDTSDFKLADGSVTTRDLAFPNYLMVDHSTLTASGDLLMFYLTPTWNGTGGLTFLTAGTTAAGLNISGFRDFVVPNYNELRHSIWIAQNSGIPPLVGSFPLVATGVYIFSCTTNPSATTAILGLAYGSGTEYSGYGKTFNYGNFTRIFMRVANVSEL